MAVIAFLLGMTLGVVIMYNNRPAVTTPTCKSEFDCDVAKKADQLPIDPDIAKKEYISTTLAGKVYFDAVVRNYLTFYLHSQGLDNQLDHWEYTGDKKTLDSIKCKHDMAQGATFYQIKYWLKDGGQGGLHLWVHKLIDSQASHNGIDQIAYNEEIENKAITEIISKIMMALDRAKSEGKTSYSYPTKDLSEAMIDQVSNTLLEKMGVNVQKKRSTLLLFVPEELPTM